MRLTHVVDVRRGESKERHLWLLTLTHSPAYNKHIIEHVLLS